MQKTNSTVPVSSGVSIPFNSKHLKRHSKPFGCTHDGCNKVFGAKNDWKRHENSQHHQLECWKCDIRCCAGSSGSENPGICGKFFYRKADFIKHLKTVHGNVDGWANTPTDQISSDPTSMTLSRTGPRDVAQIAADCHIPKFHGGAFWCGFCVKVIKLNGKVGIEGWDKRFDHIAWHFEKDGLRVKDSWMRLEESPPEDDGKGAEASTAKDVEGSSDEEDEDVDFNDSSPKRRPTGPTPVKAKDGASSSQKNVLASWYCVSAPDLSTFSTLVILHDQASFRVSPMLD